MKELCRGCLQQHELNARRVCAKCQAAIDKNMHPERKDALGISNGAKKRGAYKHAKRNYKLSHLPHWMFT